MVCGPVPRVKFPCGARAIDLTSKRLLACPSGSVHGVALLLELEELLLELEGPLLELDDDGGTLELELLVNELLDPEDRLLDEL